MLTPAEQNSDLFRALGDPRNRAGAYPLGKSIAEGLKRCTNLARHLLTGAEKADLSELAEYLQRQPAFTPVESNHASLYGYHGRFPVYCLFEAANRWRREVDLIRAFATVALVRTVGKDFDPAPFVTIGRLVRKLESSQPWIDGDELVAYLHKVVVMERGLTETSVSKFREKLREWDLDTTDDQFSALRWVTDLALDAENSALSWERRRRKRIAQDRLARRDIRKKYRSSQKKPRVQRDVRYRSSREYREVVREGLAPGDAGEEVLHHHVEAVGANDWDIAELVALRSFRYFQRRPFSTLSNESLTPEEAQMISSALLKELGDQTSPQELREAASLVMLQLITGQSKSTLAELVWSESGIYSGQMSVNAELVQAVPDYESFHGYRSVRPSKHVRGFIRLPVPDAIVLPLGDSIAARRAKIGQRIFSAGSKRLILEANRLLVRVRESVVRATAERIAGTLPAMLYEKSRDLRHVQLLCGSSFGMSTAPLHYYSVPSEVLLQDYEQVVSAIIGMPASISRSGWHLGSALGVCRYEVKALVASLDQAVESLMGRGGGRRSVESWIKLVNAISLKTAWMFAAASGWRNSEAVGKVRRTDFRHDGGAAVIDDKVAVSTVRPFRIVSLGETVFPNQLNGLLTLYQKLLEVFGAQRKWKGFREAIGQALDGSGSLFLQFDLRAGRCASADLAWMTSAFPVGLKIPRHIFRHRLATAWCEAGGRPIDLYHQLGHDEFSDHQFGAATVDAPIEFLARCAPVVEQCLAADGWTTTGLSLGNFNKPPVPDPFSCVSYAKAVAAKQRRNPEAFATQTGRLRRAEVEAISTAIAEYLDQGNVLDPGASDQELNRLAQALCGAAGISPRATVIRSMMLRLRRAAAALSDPNRRTFKFTVSEESAQQVPHVVPMSVLAQRAMENLRMLHDGVRPKLKIDGSDAANFAALELLLYQPLPSEQVFESALVNLHLAKRVRGDAGCLCVPTRTEDGSDGEIYLSATLSARLAQVVARGERLIFDHADFERYVGDLAASRGWKRPKRNLTKWILELSCESGALEWPGYLWASIVQKRKNKSLDVAATAGWRQGAVKFDNIQDADQSSVRVASKSVWVRQSGANWAKEIAAIRAVFSTQTGNESAKRKRAATLLSKLNEDFARGETFNLATIASAYALKLLGPGQNKQTGKYLAVSTVGGYTNIAIKALRIAGSELSSNMSILSVYRLLLDPGATANDGDEFTQATAPDNAKNESTYRDRQEALQRLHQLLVEQFGFEDIEPEDWPCSWGAGPTSPFAEVLSTAEFERVQSILEAWELQAKERASEVSPRLVHAARLSFLLQYRLGLRPGEAIGLTAQDMQRTDTGALLLLVRQNILRRLKTDNAMRPLRLDDFLTVGEMRLIQDCIGEATLHPSAPLLLRESEFATERAIVDRLIRLALRRTVGARRARQNICRHSAACNRFAKNWLPKNLVKECPGPGSPRLQDLWELGQWLGHSSQAVSLSNYIHVDALASAGLAARPEPTKSQVAVWSGRDLANRRHWARRRTEVGSAVETSMAKQVAGIVAERCQEEPTIPPVEMPDLELPDDDVLRTPTTFSTLLGLLQALAQGEHWNSAIFKTGVLPHEQNALLNLVSRSAAAYPDLSISRDVFQWGDQSSLADPLLNWRSTKRAGKPQLKEIQPIVERFDDSNFCDHVLVWCDVFRQEPLDPGTFPGAHRSKFTPSSFGQATALVEVLWWASGDSETYMPVLSGRSAVLQIMSTYSADRPEHSARGRRQLYSDQRDSPLQIGLAACDSESKRILKESPRLLGLLLVLLSLMAGLRRESREMVYRQPINHITT